MQSARRTTLWTKFTLQARTIAPTSARKESPNRAPLETRPVAEALHLFQALAHGQPVREFDEVFAVANKGFKDCVHGRPGSSRQLLLMDVETLDEFGVAPGRVKANITTCGIRLEGLLMGQRIRAGE